MVSTCEQENTLPGNSIIKSVDLETWHILYVPCTKV